ncbi:ribosome quality control complex subunit TCF25 isoform X2 [Battus philenor]|uniref:ribosome quality control complex subunit TCF25 isoform X2 n=1 Tax=Battus philenor TaxID=42288 RepID=UPI0035CEC919
MLKMDAISSSPLHNREVNDPVKYVHKINLWFINVKNELRKICGPRVGEELPRNRGRVSQFRRIPRELIIQTNNGIPMSGGLSMIRLANKNDGVYFKFNHSKNYQIAHLSFLLVSDHRFTNPQFSPHDNTYKHMEAMLEIADSLFFKNECLIASNIIESIIYQMQSAVHPHFRISDTMCRLEYRYIENRAFHIALLKYAYIVSNRACHRTALEICKVLMNLDQSDPLAVAFVIDTFAIRAREYEWLVNAIEYLNKEKSASSMFNMAYSHALAKYHLAIRDNNERDKCAATELLRNAIYGFPVIAMFYLQLASCREAVNFPTDPFFYLHSHCEIRLELTYNRCCKIHKYSFLELLFFVTTVKGEFVF